MPHNPADDIPAQSVQESEVKHTGAACPQDGTLVTCSGPRGAKYVQGACPVCAHLVFADASLISQVGTFNQPDSADLEAPKENTDAEHSKT